MHAGGTPLTLDLQANCRDDLLIAELLGELQHLLPAVRAQSHIRRVRQFEFIGEWVHRAEDSEQTVRETGDFRGTALRKRRQKR